MLEGRMMLTRGPTMEQPFKVVAVPCPPPPYFYLAIRPALKFWMNMAGEIPDDSMQVRKLTFELDCVIGGEAIYYLQL